MRFDRAIDLYHTCFGVDWFSSSEASFVLALLQVLGKTWTCSWQGPSRYFIPPPMCERVAKVVHSGRLIQALCPKKVTLSKILFQTIRHLFRFSAEQASPFWSMSTNVYMIQKVDALFLRGFEGSNFPIMHDLWPMVLHISRIASSIPN